jgi:hypothetical protein
VLTDPVFDKLPTFAGPKSPACRLPERRKNAAYAQSGMITHLIEPLEV